MSSDTPPEESVADILHALSTRTQSSPLLCMCSWEEGSRGKKSISWDPFVSGISNGPGGETCGEQLLQTILGNTGVKDEDVAHLKPLFGDKDQLDALVDGGARPTDAELWRAGVDLLRLHLSPGEEGSEPIPPHILLQTVMDSYYCRDADFDLGHLSARLESSDGKERLFHLPSPLALFILRSYLISFALESAEKSIRPSLESDEPVRWRRLKSMADDALALFRRMTVDYVGHAVDSLGSDESNPHVGPDLVVSVAAWSYCNFVFPSCRGLLEQLLRNRNKMPSRTLESCYESFRMFTSLLALDVTTVEQDYEQPSRCCQLIMEQIECLETDRLFSLTKNAQEEMNRKEIEGVEMQDTCYRPWKDENAVMSARGKSLEEDLLLSPPFRKLHENSDKASPGSFYDEIGVGVIAYWKLRACVDQSAAPLHALPCPYSGSYHWSLLFSHVITFLCGLEASSTLEKMDEDDVLCKTDDCLAGIGRTVVSLGFDMLHTIVNEMPAIKPLRTFTETMNPIVKLAQSAQGLQSTIVVLLLHVTRLSSLEMSRGDRPSSEIYPALKYSSKEVLEMAQTLLQFYDPSSQILALSAACQNIEPKDKVIVSKLLDFVRPVVMGVSKSVEQYNNKAVAMKDVVIMKECSKTLDPFLNTIDALFDESSAPLPRNVGEFMSSRETYTSVFANVRWMRTWIARCDAVEEYMKADPESFQRFRRISDHMQNCLGKIQTFERCLDRLIDFWDKSDDRPDDWHQLFLVRLALQDALKPPEKWEAY